MSFTIRDSHQTGTFFGRLIMFAPGVALKTLGTGYNGLFSQTVKKIFQRP